MKLIKLIIAVFLMPVFCIGQDIDLRSFGDFVAITSEITVTKDSTIDTNGKPIEVYLDGAFNINEDATLTFKDPVMILKNGPIFKGLGIPKFDQGSNKKIWANWFEGFHEDSTATAIVPALNRAEESCWISSEEGLYIDHGEYNFADSTWIIGYDSNNDLSYEFGTINIYGSGRGFSSVDVPQQSETIFISTSKEVPTVVMSQTKNNVFQGIVFKGTMQSGDFDMPNMDDKELHTIATERGIRDSVRSPYCAIAVDPFSRSGFDDHDKWPGLEKYYGRQTNNSAATDVTIKDCYFFNHFIGIAFTLGNGRANNEDLHILSPNFVNTGIGVVSCQTQARSIEIKAVLLNQIYSLFNGKDYGNAGTPGPYIEVVNGNTMKYAVQLAGDSYVTLKDFYCEELFGIVEHVDGDGDTEGNRRSIVSIEGNSYLALTSNENGLLESLPKTVAKIGQLNIDDGVTLTRFLDSYLPFAVQNLNVSDSRLQQMVINYNDVEPHISNSQIGAATDYDALNFNSAYAKSIMSEQKAKVNDFLFHSLNWINPLNIIVKRGDERISINNIDNKRYEVIDTGYVQLVKTGDSKGYFISSNHDKYPVNSAIVTQRGFPLLDTSYFKIFTPVVHEMEQAFVFDIDEIGVSDTVFINNMVRGLPDSMKVQVVSYQKLAPIFQVTTTQGSDTIEINFATAGGGGGGNSLPLTTSNSTLDNTYALFRTFGGPFGSSFLYGPNFENGFTNLTTVNVPIIISEPATATGTFDAYTANYTQVGYTNGIPTENGFWIRGAKVYDTDSDSIWICTNSGFIRNGNNRSGLTFKLENPNP